MFDFDGTLTRRDTVVPFLRLAAGTGRVAVALVLAACAWPRRNAMKAALIRRTLRGRAAVEIDELGTRFARHVVDGELRPDVVERVEWHRAQAHDLVIVSASLTPYLRPVAQELRFTTALGTELEVDPEGRLTGELRGANVRRAEKVRRLDAWLGDRPAEIWAYGDSKGDRELLERADRPVRVTRRSTSRPGCG